MTPIPSETSVAFVITELEVGGAERCLVNLATGLDRTRFEPAVFVLAPPPPSPRDGLVQQLEQAHVPTHFLGFSSKLGLFAAVRDLTQRLATVRPQIVQSMLFHANVLTRLSVRQQPGPCWCAGIRVADPSRCRQAVERRALRIADRIACVSQLVANYAANQLKVPAEKLLVIPNGIDVQAIAKRDVADLTPFGVPRSQRVITCVARLAPQKGIDQLLSVAPHILGSLPTHDLLLIGQGPQGAELRRMARRKGVADRVHFLGWQPNVVEILLASDLLVLPSRWEGMPNVLLEAMACSRPVVCTRAEGILEVLGPLAQRQTVPVEKPQVLAEKVVAILREPSLGRQLGTENRRRICRHFSLSDMVRQYEQLYLGLSRAASTGRK
ncbi:MAG: glycosyltransferase [Planctomycetota bacterium]